MAQAADPSPDAIAAALIERGVAVVDRFQSAEETRALARCLEGRRARGDLAPARIGAPGEATRRADIRGDATCWIIAPLEPAEARLMQALEGLRLGLNRAAMLGLFELEAHYAIYPEGAAYARHVDQPRGRTQRRVSLALYLNEGWGEEDGGALRLHGEQGGHCDIAPLGGRLCCFLTQGREHEVLPARRERRSISGWFRGRD